MLVAATNFILLDDQSWNKTELECCLRGTGEVEVFKRCKLCHTLPYLAILAEVQEVTKEVVRPIYEATCCLKRLETMLQEFSRYSGCMPLGFWNMARYGKQ